MRKLLLLPVCFLFFASYMLAQETLDPNQYVNIQIASDTLSNGTHDPAKTVYKAESGQIYAFDGTLYIDFPLVIEGPDNTWIYKQAAPPVFLQTPAATARDFFNLRAGGSITIKNIMLSGSIGDGTHMIEMIQNAAGDSIIADNCVFTDHDSHAIKVTAGAQKVSVTNCIFINGIRYRFNPYGGMPIRIDGAVNNILLENNTVVNSSRLLGNGGNFFHSNFIELHNTYVNQQVNAHELHWFNAIQANNIFYNWSWRGRQPNTNGYEAYFTTWDRFSDVKNNLDSVALYHGYNLLYLDPKFTDYWKNELAADTVEQCLLWNTDVDSTIEADNNFTIGKDYWQIDPGFTTPPNNIDSMLAWDKGFWSPSQPADAPDWSVTPPITYDASGNPILTWPPPFDLSYSNTAMQKAGTDGLPLGDLNWFPASKTTYEANRATYIAALQDSMTNATYVYIPGDSASALITSIPTAVNEQSSNIPKKYSLSNNYPNPFNPSTTIKFGLPEQSDVTLTVYNVLGQKVLELTKSYAAGQHSYNFNASKLSSGVYIYSIHAAGVSGKNFVQSKKMMLLK